MKSSFVRFFGGLGVGVLIMVSLLWNAPGTPMNLSHQIPGFSGMNAVGLLQGVLLGLVLFLLAQVGIRSVHPKAPVRAEPLSVEFYRQRRLRRRQHLKRFGIE